MPSADGARSVELHEVAEVIDPNPSHRYPQYEAGGVPILATEQFRGINDWEPAGAKLATTEFHADRRSCPA